VRVESSALTKAASAAIATEEKTVDFMLLMILYIDIYELVVV